MSRKRNLHVRLDEDLYRRLRAEAERSLRPPAELARDAIDQWLHKQHRVSVHREIARYAAKRSGTVDDLDRVLEAAALEHLTRRKRSRK